MPDNKLPHVIKFLTAAAFFFGIYAFYCLWMIADEKTVLWGAFYGLELAASLVCLWGMIQQKPWALILSLMLMLAALAFGINLVHFVWTFWIFEKPTLADRFFSALHPRVSVFIVFPVIWLAYFLRRQDK